MKKILILCNSQFGYLTDTYMYCKHLDKNNYHITYYCFDVGKPKLVIENINVVYYKSHGNKVLNFVRFLFAQRRFIQANNFDLIFHVDTKYSMITRLLNIRQSMVLDIRTGYIHQYNFVSRLKNFKILLLTCFYKNVTVISESLRKRLLIPKYKTTILPLGAECNINMVPKSFNKLKLLYIGSLDFRNIDQTVEGLYYFIKKYPNVEIKYDIVGFGYEDTEKNLLNCINHLNLGSCVTFHGRKNIEELNTFLNYSNIGILYVPQIRVYDCQPSTKLYEYALSGMAIIATRTFENLNLLPEKCGVFIDDNPQSFSKGIEDIIANSTKYNSRVIKELFRKNTWERVVKNILEPYFEKLTF